MVIFRNGGWATYKKMWFLFSSKKGVFISLILGLKEIGSSINCKKNNLRKLIPTLYFRLRLQIKPRRDGCSILTIGEVVSKLNLNTTLGFLKK